MAAKFIKLTPKGHVESIFCGKLLSEYTLQIRLDT